MKHLAQKDFHDFPIYICMRTNYKDICTMSNMHYHNGYEFFFVTSGSCEFFFNNESFSLSKGKLLIIPPGFLHRSVYSSVAQTYRIELHIIPSQLGEIALKITSKYTKPQMLDISVNKRDYIYDIVRKIQKEDTINDSYSTAMQNRYLDELLIYIERYALSPQHDNTKSAISQLIMEYINNNFHHKISVPDISDYLHINTHTLFTEFKKFSNLTISEYISYVRISHAEQLLISTDLSITDIAFECGFNDSNYFSSVFKKIKGISPTQFAKINKI